MRSTIEEMKTSGVQVSLSWDIDDAVSTRSLILENLNDRSNVVDLMLGFVARNFQGRGFSMRSLRDALGLDPALRTIEKNGGDKITNLLYDATRRGHTKTLVANIGEYEGVTHYSLTEDGWNYYNTEEEDNLPTVFHDSFGASQYHSISEFRVVNPLASEPVTLPSTLTMVDAIEAIRKLDAKVKSLEATVNNLYDQNVDLQEKLDKANQHQATYTEISADIAEILRDLT